MATRKLWADRFNFRGKAKKITDARQIIQQKKRINVNNNRVVNDLSQNLRSRNNTSHRLGNRGGHIAKRNITPFNINRAPNPALKKINFRNGKTIQKQAQNKFINVQGGNITVTARQQSQQQQFWGRKQNPVEDELEQMSLSDLPELQESVVSKPDDMHIESLFQTKTCILPQGGVPTSTSLIVTNLKHTVTEGDIIELFGVIGQLGEAHLLHPGAAMVSYLRKEDANSAVEQYDNVTLDGMPMHCSILSQQSQVAKPSISSRLGGRTFPLEPTLPALISTQTPQRILSSQRTLQLSNAGFRSDRFVQSQTPPVTASVRGRGKSNTKFTVCLN